MSRVTPLRLISLAVALGSGSFSHAALTYAYRTDATSVNVFPSGSVSVPVYLQEVSTNGTPSRFASDGGLFSTGLRADRLSGATTITITSLLHNPAFTTVKSVTLAPTQAKFLEANLTANVATADQGNGIREILVGTLTFSSAPIVGTTQFRIGDFDLNGPSSDTLTGLGNVIDVAGGSNPASTLFTVVSVPEPGSLALVLPVLLPLLRRRR